LNKEIQFELSAPCAARPIPIATANKDKVLFMFI
jgi:hypothetical protein